MQPWREPTQPVIYTYTGQQLNPLNPRPAQLAIRDIAHALACCNRFAGHCKEPLSVAQHSCYAARLCWDTPYAIQALLHDAAEAYLSDVTKWLKADPCMAGYREAEARVQRLVYAKWGCPLEDAEPVKVADRLLVRYEMQQGFGDGFTVGALQPARELDYPPLTQDEVDRVEAVNKWFNFFPRWEYWPWKRAEHEFLSLYRQLTENDDYRVRQQARETVALDPTCALK